MIWRTFLVPAHTGADSYVRVSSNEYSCELKIADCTRTVSLDFRVHDAKDRKHMLAKVAKLRRALDHVETYILSKKGFVE